ncbi:MAG: MoaD/ThiS family protein [Planctomycetes bacterium]|nr:MoaD/ThiS family protein [Planctomycetota bacterium]
MRVLIPTLLDRYTEGERELQGAGGTVGEVLADLEARFPGIRFRLVDEHDRIRKHIHVFVGRELAPDLASPVRAEDTVKIVGALSGG